MKSILRLASAAAAALLMSQVANTAQAKGLNDYEYQFVKFIWDLEFEKANFYVTQGLVDPHNLSSGKELPYYFFGPGTLTNSRCRAPSAVEPSLGNCMPHLDITHFLVSGGFDLNKPVNGKARPLTYVCWGKSLGVNNTRILVTEEHVEAEFYDDAGFTPLQYCAWRGTRGETGSEESNNFMLVLTTLIHGGADINSRLKIEQPIAPYSDTPINPGATPVMLSLLGWYKVNPDYQAQDIFFVLGADPKAEDDMGAGIVNYLVYPDRDYMYEPVLKMLKQLHDRGVDIMHPRPKDGKTFVDLAMQQGDVEFAMQIMAIAKGQ